MQRSLAAVFAFAAIVVFAPSALAQSACGFPACNGARETYDRASGNCQSSSGPPTFALSHRVPTCGAGEHFDRDTGNCVLDACSGGGCEARALCTGDWRYARSGSDSTGAYGVCESGPNWLGHRSHTLVRCPAGFALNEARGVCVGNCRVVITPAPGGAVAPAPILRLPDLIIRRSFLRASSGGPAVTQVRRGQRYWACFVVENIGTAASGAFHVGGGGLGLTAAPSQGHAALAPGASREGCLLYSTTPPVGSFRLGLEADSRRIVRETREDNNIATIAVNVIA